MNIFVYDKLWGPSQRVVTLFAGTEAPETGRGTDADWDFCSSSNRCKYKEGDCDNDSECVDDHVCGQNNCRHFWNDAVSGADCCLPGDKTLVEYKTLLSFRGVRAGQLVLSVPLPSYGSNKLYIVKAFTTL